MSATPMPTTNQIQRTADIHRLYCQLTGLDFRYMPLEHDSTWYLFLKDFDENDLRAVVPYLQRHYKDKPDILRACLRFRHLIECRSYFAEYLAESKAMKPKHPMTDREWVLRRTGRECAKHDPVPAQAKTPEQVLRESRFVATHMAEFRRSMKWV